MRWFSATAALVFPAVLAAAAGGCGAAPEAETATPAKPEAPARPAAVEEPAFKVWEMGALGAATTSPAVPFLIDESGARLDVPCFERARGLDPWNTSRARVIEKLEENAAGITAAIRAWAREVMFAGEAVAGLADTLEIGWRTPAIVHAPDKKVRLLAEQACIDADTRFLPEGARVVTTMFGAREVRFTGSEPLTKARLAALRRAAEKAGLRFRPLSAEGEPPTRGRPASGFRLSPRSPLWFAWGDLPDGAWAREHDPEQCRVNLVFDDFIPRVPECDGPADVGFGASRGATDDEVVLKVSADGVTARAEATLGETVMIQAGGRVLVWLTARQIVEGVELEVDTLVLDPAGGPGGDLARFGKPPGPAKKKRP